jgi:hypothetical protein
MDSISISSKNKLYRLPTTVYDSKGQPSLTPRLLPITTRLFMIRQAIPPDPPAPTMISADGIIMSPREGQFSEKAAETAMSQQPPKDKVKQEDNTIQNSSQEVPDIEEHHHAWSPREEVLAEYRKMMGRNMRTLCP